MAVSSLGLASSGLSSLIGACCRGVDAAASTQVPLPLKARSRYRKAGSTRRSLWRALSFVAATLVLTSSDARACSQVDVAQDLRTLAARLDPRARGALERIDGLGRRLLAARSYLRIGDGLAARWSWTSDEIDAYKRSEEYAVLRRELAKVIRRFEERNAGYTLHVNLEARSFELQLERWNENASVARAAERLLDAAVAGRCGEDASHEPLRSFLSAWRPPALPTLAAPGLSLHGQLRAFDFQVKQGDRTVAGPNTATIRRVWTAQGWTVKLRNAVRSASPSLRGPLVLPDEPWHYVYEPAP